VPETRTKLKHLLEDIRDNYPFPIEEAIITELIANSLDSKCSVIDLQTDPRLERLTLTDDGEGMTRTNFVEYHDIASTGKVRGKGIGFAGVGAKLALLICREIFTETKRRAATLSSRWWLQDEYRAPWEMVQPLGLVPHPSGTAVRLQFHRSAADCLLDPAAVADIARKHFYPLLDHEFTTVLRLIYPRGVTIRVNGESVELPQMDRSSRHYTVVRIGRRKRPVGIGFVETCSDPLPEDDQGIAISTYGKVIKRGWDWLGIRPRNPDRITGVVEVPEMVQCLTTNKSDFLRDPTNLQRYYKYRRYIQQAISVVLERLGEFRHQEGPRDKALEKLQKEIDRVVADILPEFPELAPLFGRKKRDAEVTTRLPDDNGAVSVEEQQGADTATGDKGGPGSGGGVEGATDGPFEGTHLEPTKDGSLRATERTGRRKRPGLMISFDEESGGPELAWLRETTLYVNALHPAFERVRGTHSVGLYITFVAACELSTKVQEERQPMEFIQKFMAAWGAQE